MDNEDLQSGQSGLKSRSDDPVIRISFSKPSAGNPTATSVKKNHTQVSFDRRELSEILRVYGHRVAEGEWRDYAMDFQKDKAVFSIFKRTSEMPIYRVEKDPKLAKKQGAYAVLNSNGMILKRGHELRQVLKVLEKRKHLHLVD